jgi:hypothetical protein
LFLFCVAGRPIGQQMFIAGGIGIDMKEHLIVVAEGVSLIG